MNKTKQGLVISTAMAKSIVVRVDRKVPHPRYKKYYRRSKKFLVDSPDGLYQVGDRVVITETRPVSRRKRWAVIGKVKENNHASVL